MNQPQREGRGALRQALRVAGGRELVAAEGDIVFRFDGVPDAFVYLVSGRIGVRFRELGAGTPFAACRITGGEDCLPLTAALLGRIAVAGTGRALTRVHCVVLDAARFEALLLRSEVFRAALFSDHARRLPFIFARAGGAAKEGIDARLADWLLAQPDRNGIRTTHQRLAADLVTAREVVTRRLRLFADRGWIVQSRGIIIVTGAAALSRLARGHHQWSAAPMQGEGTGRKSPARADDAPR
ncbi:Crp/Fnr family transcriptional regulator [Acuticoccus mangrovi]|uniref:Crp/Fnr family transcriptional regulator n=1 Tax=Acuticoccus mangrovi TaxID=2796142 RepID=A0A934IG71_9HYPH|nr:Crp/Fnr family transcriptional regulator [Acuticoccus mangrovi]MBJ3775878.1 Crp/Fnr family transcriptional regulator [Acuticoccus mangrovi]